MHSKLRNAGLIVASSLVGVLAGALILGPNLSLASDTSTPVTSVVATDGGKFRDPRPEEVVAVPPYPVNENGQTYGSGMNVDGDNHGPDLVAAYGSDGEFGYVLAGDTPAPATSLVTDFAQQDEGSYIPLYASDGKTVVGRYRIVPGRVTTR